MSKFSGNCVIPLHRKWACDLQTGWPTCRLARIAMCLCCTFLCSLWYLSRCMIKSSVWYYNSNQLFILCESWIHCLISPWNTRVWLINKLLWDKIGCALKNYHLGHGTLLLLKNTKKFGITCFSKFMVQTGGLKSLF